MTEVRIHDDTNCLLGEGAFWHPERAQFFWFDILGRKLHTTGRHWEMDRIASAAGWIDRDRLLIATETGLTVLNLESGATEDVAEIEADNEVTRSNDGRADPMGGFWYGTMGKHAEADAGSIYRYYKGEVRTMWSGLSITNAICFAPDGRTAYHACTARRVIRTVDLDADGWPAGEPRIFLDLNGEGLNPDGAVTDADGNLWNAQWGSGRVACYDPAGTFLRAVDFPARQTSCPAFGGPDYRTLFCTSAAEGLGEADLADDPRAGQTFAVDLPADLGIAGRPEPRVIL
ncbi:SMP-30/gluconolactonase/LRE family protein [Wenxinia saemankumensis]|uniref:Sugar lactone lactonase YvrE n=1 Tax=Wenxinia saemankumensis TaxID=1447782 RepID=A0A1M6E4X1_9RHOB|nr:SMP-30/gluconolactonase/LRE family protein [Wenxinia saemankumensis]SHI80491.1 Sugar lactone lactonase YvrE [Wenxinia saemankumensis]